MEELGGGGGGGGHQGHTCGFKQKLIEAVSQSVTVHSNGRDGEYSLWPSVGICYKWQYNHWIFTPTDQVDKLNNGQGTEVLLWQPVVASPVIQHHKVGEPQTAILPLLITGCRK